MSSLADQILRRTQEGGSSPVRFAVVESVAGGLASVRVGGVVVEDCTWRRSYAPVVGDRVAVLASGSGWLILDAVAQQPSVWNEPESVFVRPIAYGDLPRPAWSESWDGHLPTRYDGPWWEIVSETPDAHPWNGHRVAAGMTYGPGYKDEPGYVPELRSNAAFVWYPRLSEVVPSGAEIVEAALVIRTEFVPMLGSAILYPRQVRPVFHAHSVPYVGTGAASGSGEAPEFYFAEGFDAWDVGEILAGELHVAQIPDNIVSGLVAGTLTGIALWHDEASGISLSDRYETIDANGLPVTRWLTNDLLSIRLTYRTSVEEDEQL